MQLVQPDEYELLDGRRILGLSRSDLEVARGVLDTFQPSPAISHDEALDALARAVACIDALRARRECRRKLLAHLIPQEIHARVQAWKQAGGREGSRLS